MAAIQMYIDKFQRVVTIDEDHPLAIAQRANDASNPAAAADTRKASAPAASTPPASTASDTVVSIDPLRTDDDLLDQFRKEALERNYSPEASDSIAAGRLRHLRAGGNGYSWLEEPEKTQEKTPAPSIFDLPPELRGIPAVQAHLEGLSRKDLQELAKQHEIPANQSSSDLVELLTLTLTTPAP